MIDIVLVTQKACLKPNSELVYTSVATEENSILSKSLSKSGLKVKIVGWEDKDFDWSSTRIAMIRNTWNYSDNIEEFKKWLKIVSKKTMLLNSANLILWNLDKRYLLDLEKNGISIPKTYVLNNIEEWDTIIENNKYLENGMVVKPVSSAGAKDTYFLKLPYNIDHIQAINSIVKKRPMLIQPFISSIKDKGEISMVFINGNFTYAMTKKPAHNDFRVQFYYGGTLEEYTPTTNEINFGKKAIQVCEKLKGLPIFSRVDFCYDDKNEPILMELEMIEPQLWLPESELTVSCITEGIKSLIK